jgi:hypothetical protein
MRILCTFDQSEEYKELLDYEFFINDFPLERLNKDDYINIPLYYITDDLVKEKILSLYYCEENRSLIKDISVYVRCYIFKKDDKGWYQKCWIDEP